MRVLVTGSSGFVASHVVEHLLRIPEVTRIVGLDKLGEASEGYDRLRDSGSYDDPRVTLLTHDLVLPFTCGLKKEIGEIDFVLHLAAESHVDRSIVDPMAFAMANTIGTVNMLMMARDIPGLKKMLYFSTDEVFGPAPVGHYYEEWERFCPSNPYSAGKAGGECFADAFVNTYKLPCITTHTMNVFGERQHPEKFIPKVIRAVLQEEEVLIHADPTMTQAGSRCWIHARNVAAAVEFLLYNGEVGDRYNIVGEEMDNLSLARLIAQVIGKPLHFQLVDYHSSRPGHDLRYALSGQKMESMGWHYPKTLTESLRKTVEWTLARPRWLGMEEECRTSSARIGT